MSTFQTLKARRNKKSLIPDDRLIVPPQSSCTIGIYEEEKYSTKKTINTLRRLPEIPTGFGFEVKSNEKEYGLYAKKTFSPGELVLTDEPYSYSVNHDKIQVTCHHCLVTDAELFSCKSCKLIHYCSVKCQSKDWNDHREECLSLQKAAKVTDVEVTESLRLMSRILRKRYKDVSSYERKVRNLYGSRECFDQKKLEDFGQGLLLIKQLVGERILTSAVDHLLDLFCKVALNSCSICNEENISVATGLYPVFSLINNDCNPNVCVTFSGALMNVRALREIKAGEEICLFYAGLNEPKHLCRKFLRENYLFDCKCESCELYLGGKPDEKVSVKNNYNPEELYKTIMEINEDSNYECDMTYVLEVLCEAEQFLGCRNYYLDIIRNYAAYRYIEQSQYEFAYVFFLQRIKSRPEVNPLTSVDHVTACRLACNVLIKPDVNLLNMVKEAKRRLFLTHGMDNRFTQEMIALEYTLSKVVQ
jgi:hypothetical protein